MISECIGDDVNFYGAYGVIENSMVYDGCFVLDVFKRHSDGVSLLAFAMSKSIDELYVWADLHGIEVKGIKQQ